MVKSAACAQSSARRRPSDFSQTEQTVDLDVGAVIMATGFDVFDPTPMTQYGYGQYDNVLTGLQFERLNNAVGPTGGKILLKNGEAPESVAILHCVGSRDAKYHPYCSRVCCMYALKYDHLLKDKVGHDCKIYNFYIDMRCFGKGYEEFFRRVQEEGVTFIRGRPAEITNQAQSPEEEGKLIVVSEDTLLGRVMRVPVDMAILCTAMEPRADVVQTARTFGISQGLDGFFLEEHPKLGPVSTATDGIFLAGSCQGAQGHPGRRIPCVRCGGPGSGADHQRRGLHFADHFLHRSGNLRGLQDLHRTLRLLGH